MCTESESCTAGAGAAGAAWSGTSTARVGGDSVNDNSGSGCGGGSRNGGDVAVRRGNAIRVDVGVNIITSVGCGAVDDIIGNLCGAGDVAGVGDHSG